jgi:xanthine dehydrogenase accessory factor
MTPALLEALTQARAAKRPVVVATKLPTGEQLLLPDETAHQDLAEAAQRALTRDESGTVTIGNETWFLNVYNPPMRLIVVGAVHIAQALMPMASALGLATTIIDPRRAFASLERFPNVELSHDWPDEAMESLAPDVRTAVVTLTHDPKIDDPGLDVALKSPAFYIGALGSRRTHARRLDRLRELGHSDEILARIRGPVGLNIHAVTAPEIALSILAEIVAVRRNAPVLSK